MSKIFNYLFAILMLGVVAGCTSTYINQPSSPLVLTAKAEIKPIIQIGEKIEATASVSRIAYFFISGPGNFAEGVHYQGNYREANLSESFFGDIVAQAKAAAAYKACSENEADFIVCPRYYIIIDKYPFYSNVQAKVFGYKGVLKGVEVPPEPKAYVPPIQKIQIINPVKISQPIKLDQPIMLKEPLRQDEKPLIIQKNKASAKAGNSLNSYVK